MSYYITLVGIRNHDICIGMRFCVKNFSNLNLRNNGKSWLEIVKMYICMSS